jgi:hypothetical protein
VLSSQSLVDKAETLGAKDHELEKATKMVAALYILVVRHLD